MGLAKKMQAKKNQGGGSDGVFGLSIQSLKPINTKPPREKVYDEEESSCLTTPTAKEARIPEPEQCPPAPRRPRRSRCNYRGVREFFSPPDLETVFVRRVEKF